MTFVHSKEHLFHGDTRVLTIANGSPRLLLFEANINFDIGLKDECGASKEVDIII